MTPRIKRAFLDTGHGQLLYRTAGRAESGEALLLLHMSPRSSDEFLELMPLLATNRQVIAMDMMGFGDSDTPPDAYAMADYAADAIALLDALNLPTVSILGHTFGAFVAGEIAAAYPKRVNHLILCNILGLDTTATANVNKKYATGFVLQADGSHLLERWNARLEYIGSPGLNHRWVLDDLKAFGRTAYAARAATTYWPNSAARFQQINSATLLLWGLDEVNQFERQGLAKAENRFWVTQAIANHQVIELDHGTICMMNQIPHEIAQIVEQFLAT